MIAHRYRLLRPRDEQAWRALLSPVLQAWQRDWGVDAELVACRAAHTATGLPDRCWHAHATANGVSLWLNTPPDLARALEKPLFGLHTAGPHVDANAASTLAADVAATAADALAAAVLRACGADIAPSFATAVPCQSRLEHQFRRGAGAVLLTVAVADTQLLLLLPAELIPAAADAPTAPARPRARLAHALASLPVTLAVEAGHVELSLGQLHSLAIGDVLALSARIDQVLQVRGPDPARSLCAAYLGQVDGMRAIEIQPPSTQGKP